MDICTPYGTNCRLRNGVSQAASGIWCIPPRENRLGKAAMQDSQPKVWFLYDILIWNNWLVEDGSVVFTADSLSRAKKLVELWAWDHDTNRYSIRESKIENNDCKPTGKEWYYYYGNKKWREGRNG